MDSSQGLAAVNYYPETYKLEMEASAFEEILQMFSEEILQGCAHSETESTLVGYVTSIIEPVGWRAVWRSAYNFSVLNLENDFIVEVVNVSLEKLEAEVLIKSVILDSCSECVFNDLKRKIYVDAPITVPLIELYTISEGDDEELFAKTATAIENVRFFMTHLSRPWDSEIDDVVYTEKLLRPRLQLYFDMKNNVLPKAITAKIMSILKQGWRILKELNNLYADMNMSDSEAELNEDDLLESMTRRTKLAELQAKMEILENPTIRNFMMKKHVPKRSSGSEKKSSPIVFIVSKQFTHEMVANLPVKSSAVLEFEHSAETAFRYSSAGDRILIFPGVYQCDSLGWFEGEISVEGIGSAADIILEATGNSEVFLNSCSNHVSLKNISLRAKSGIMSCVVVHHGEIRFQDCIIDCNRSDIGVLLLGGSEATLESCVIFRANEDAIQMRPSSSLNLVSCNIRDCKRHGIQIDADTENANVSCSELLIANSIVSGNGGHGLFLNNVPIADLSLRKPSGDFSVLKLFHWLKSTIENSELDANKEAGVGISSFCKIHPEGTPVGNKVVPSCPKPEDINVSALSDFLNEISFSEMNGAHCADLRD